MTDTSSTPINVEELKALIQEWMGYEAGEGEKIPQEIEEQYGEDPLAGVEHETYMKALEELHDEGIIDDGAYEQAADQLESADDYSSTGLINNLNIVINNTDNSIHTGDDFSGHIDQGDTINSTVGGDGIAAGGDVYDSPVVTGDDNNLSSGEGDAGDGDDISADGAHIGTGDGGAVNFGSGSAAGSNTDNSTYEDNDPYTDNSTHEDNDPYTDNSTYTDNDPYTDNSSYEDNDQVHVEVEVEDGYEEHDAGYKPEVVDEYDPGYKPVVVEEADDYHADGGDAYDDAVG